MEPISFVAFKIDFSTLTKAIIKSVIWFVTTAVYGMAPILLLLIVNYLAPDVGQEDRIKHLLKDLFVLFLSSAMIAEIGVEAFLSKIRFSKYAYLVFFVSSALILGIVCIAYTVIVKTKAEDQFNFNNLWLFQVVVVTFTLVYCISIKTFMFVEEDKIYKKCTP
ncbi:MAG: hypothetical protein ABIQ88_02445 [Chitinophagaceae bacterium]